MTLGTCTKGLKSVASRVKLVLRGPTCGATGVKNKWTVVELLPVKCSELTSQTHFR